MKALIFVLLAIPCFAQTPEVINVSGYQFGDADTVALHTMEQDGVVTGIVLKIDSAWALSASFSIGISGRSLTLAELGSVTSSEYTSGTVLILVESGTVLYKGEIVTLKISTPGGDTAGRLEIYPEYTYYP